MTPTDRLPGIHALRVLAAVTVYLLHVVHLTAPFVEPVTRASDHLTFGVPLFFAVSAFSLMYSTGPYRGKPGWVRIFYLKRYFRIAPLFYVMLAIDTAILSTMTLGAFFPQRPWPQWNEVLFNLTFLFGLVPNYVSSLVLVGWSVGAEMLFYLLFPLFLISIRGVWSAFAFVIVSHVMGEIARPILDPMVSLAFMTTLSDMHIVTNLRYFAFGILAFHIFDQLRTKRVASRNSGVAIAAGFHLACASLSALAIALLAFFSKQLQAMWHMEMAIWGALFTVLCVWVTIRPIRFLAWGPIQYLGERSYSLYLVHFPAILLLAAFTEWTFYFFRPLFGDWGIAITLVATYLPIVFVSAVTYRLIERPGMDVGKLLARRVDRGRTRSAVASPSDAVE